MSLGSENQKDIYTADGTAGTYDYGFKVFQDSDIRVIVVDTSDVETVLTSSQFTVAGVGRTNGGQITLSTGEAWMTGSNLTSGYKLIIKRVLELKQTVDVKNQGTFSPSLYEDALDKNVMQTQQLQEESDRSVKISEGIDESVVDPVLPAPVADQVLGWNSTGTGIENKSVTAADKVDGPVTSTDNALTRWDGTGGDTVQDSSIIVDDSDNVSGVGTLDTTGLLTPAGGIDGGDASSTNSWNLPEATTAELSGYSNTEADIAYDETKKKPQYYNGSVWKDMGGGAGGINYIDNPDAEGDTAGYTAYADAAGTSPVDGAGGSPTLTITRETGSPIRGNGSFLITKDAADRQGEGVSVDFEIDTADNSKALTISFDYKVLTGTFDYGAGTAASPSDIVVYLIEDPAGDLDGPTVLQPVPFVLDGSGRFESQFQTAAVETNYRLCFHQANSGTDAYTFAFDNVQVGPSNYTVGSTVTDWVSETPTITNFGTVSLNNVYWRRVGDELEARGQITLSAGTTGELQLNIPSGLTIDTDKIDVAGSGADTRMDVGLWTFYESGAGRTYTEATGSTGGALRMRYANSTQLLFGWNYARATTTGPDAASFASGDSLHYSYKVPIKGWGTNTQSSSNTDSRVIGAIYTMSSPANTSFAAGSPEVVDFNVKEFDSHGAVTTGASWKFTAPQAGLYSVSVISGLASIVDTKSVALTLYKGGVSNKSIARQIASSTDTTLPSGTVMVYLEAGEYIDVQMTNGDTTPRSVAEANSSISIQRIQGPSLITATELVAARATSNSGAAINVTESIYVYEDEDFDTHGFYDVSTGTATVPVAGTYEIKASAHPVSTAWTKGNGITLEAYINATTSVKIANWIAPVTDTHEVGMINGSILQKLEAGDTVAIRIQSTTSSTLDGGDGTRNFFEIRRVGL